MVNLLSATPKYTVKDVPYFYHANKLYISQYTNRYKRRSLEPSEL